MDLPNFGIAFMWKVLQHRCGYIIWKERVVVGDEQWNENYEQCSSVKDSVLGADREMQRQDSIMRESNLCM